MTEFIVWVVSPELTIVITLEGEVVAQNIDPALICSESVTEGYQSEIGKDACPSTPVLTQVDRMEEILRETEFYLQPPTGELSLSRALLNQTAAQAVGITPAVALASVAGILEAGMLGRDAALEVEALLGALSSTGAAIQLYILQPGENTTFPLLRPITPPPLPLPPPPPR